MATATSAAEAYERYSAALNADALTQGEWHAEKDGRQLACALGVIGDDIKSISDCPAQIMPRWLAKMVPWFFDRQTRADAYPWGLALYAELKRLDGNVPFSVVHDWHARYTTTLAVEVAKRRGRSPEPHRALCVLHKCALSGNNPSYDCWLDALKRAYVYANAYADAYAYAYADANADAYADADANADVYANANADAYADADANADVYANANADAYADAYANAVKSLANGMLDCLRRVEVSPCL